MTRPSHTSRLSGASGQGGGRPLRSGLSVRPNAHSAGATALEVSEYSEPEPDFALVTKEAIRSARCHPTSADLVVEVADSSLELDRLGKSRLYAEAGVVPEYWIVNLRERSLEVYRRPQDSVYQEHLVLRPGDQVKPVSIDGGPLPLHEFLPSVE